LESPDAYEIRLCPCAPLQVIFSTPAQWITPKAVFAGRLDITPSQLHFVGEVSPGDDSGTQPHAPRGAVPVVSPVGCTAL
jgi:hypothetical protein